MAPSTWSTEPLPPCWQVGRSVSGQPVPGRLKVPKAHPPRLPPPPGCTHQLHPAVLEVPPLRALLHHTRGSQLQTRQGREALLPSPPCPPGPECLLKPLGRAQLFQRGPPPVLTHWGHAQRGPPHSCRLCPGPQALVCPSVRRRRPPSIASARAHTHIHRGLATGSEGSRQPQQPPQATVRAQDWEPPSAMTLTQAESQCHGSRDPCPPSPTHRGPVDQPVGLLLALNDNAVPLPPLLGCPVMGEERQGRPLHPHPHTVDAPATGPGGSPELLSCLHDHKVPSVVDPLVQLIVVLLQGTVPACIRPGGGGRQQQATALSLSAEAKRTCMGGGGEQRTTLPLFYLLMAQEVSLLPDVLLGQIDGCKGGAG